MMSPRLRPLLVLALLALVLGPARGQSNIGEQRVGTSSGTFLKIGLDARGAGLAGTYNALVSGAPATFLNPAGIFTPDERPMIHLSYISWPAQIDIGAISYSQAFPPLGGQIAVGLMYLGTDLPETSEFYPTGTGRTLGYSDVLGTLSLSRYFTDRLSIGVSAKYLREDLGSNVGGPTTDAFLFDAGTVYSIGYWNSRLAITLSHFGADLKPRGTYRSHVSGSEVSYTAFAPPTLFQLGFSIDPWVAGRNRLTVATQLVHPADQNESLRAGLEYWFDNSYALRTGYDFAADEMGFSAGVGFRLDIAGRKGLLDYAYTQGGHLSAVHRWSLGFTL
jgi:hypothetical protein